MSQQQQLTIDSEFQNLIPPLLAEEYKQLEENIVRDGCHEPLSLWQTEDGKNILIDGHNRFRICTENGKQFETKVMTLRDRDHAKLWIGTRQLGRRNLTDDQRAVVANDVREVRSVIAVSEKLVKARV